MNILASNITLIHHIKPLLEALRAGGLRFLALKGLGLLATVYGDALHGRPMADVDLLIRPADLPEVRSLLAAHRFLPETSGKVTYCLARGSMRIKVDLHTSVWYLPDPALSDWFDRTCMGRLDDQPVPVPAPEDHLLYIAVHACLNHGHLHDCWVVDVHRLICGGVDWQVIVARGREAGNVQWPQAGSA